MTNNIIEHKPILAKIQLQNSLGLSTRYEVIYWEDNVWKRFDSNYKYFTNGEQIVEWNYCDNVYLEPSNYVKLIDNSDISIGDITLNRSGIWTEVWVNVNKKKLLLMKEIFDNEFYHTITKTGVKDLYNRSIDKKIK